MKKGSHAFTLLVLIISIPFVFAACQQEEMTDELTEGHQSTTDEIESIPVYQADLLAAPVISEATLDKEITIVSDGFPKEMEESAATIIVDSNGHHRNLLNCLDTLALSQGQKDTIRAMTKRLHYCRKVHVHEIRVINHVIVSHANHQRKVLVQKFRNGEIAKIQLHRALHELNQRTRHAFMNNPEKERHIKHVRQCFFRYLGGLHRVMNETQWQQFITCYRNW